MPDPDPTSIPELIARIERDRGQSLRQIALYGHMAASSLVRWKAGPAKPDRASCRKLADYSGYPEAFVLNLAGYISTAAPPSTPANPTVEVIPELGVLIRTFSPEEQRRYLLPTTRLALEMRELAAPYDAAPPPQEETQSPPEPTRSEPQP